TLLLKGSRVIVGGPMVILANRVSLKRLDGGCRVLAPATGHAHQVSRLRRHLSNLYVPPKVIKRVCHMPSSRPMRLLNQYAANNHRAQNVGQSMTALPIETDRARVQRLWSQHFPDVPLTEPKWFESCNPQLLAKALAITAEKDQAGRFKIRNQE